MSTRQISIEIVHADAAAEVVLDVEFKYSAGSPPIYYTAYGGDPGDPPEIEIEHIYWPTKRWDKEKREWVADHIEMDPNAIPDAVYEAIEAEIIEKHNPADDYYDEGI